MTFEESAQTPNGSVLTWHGARSTKLNIITRNYWGKEPHFGSGSIGIARTVQFYLN